MAELTFLISEFESREFAKQCKRFRNYLKNSLDSGRFLAIIYTYFYILFNGSYTFYDLLISPEKLATEAGKMNLATMSAGSFEFVVVPDKKITLSPDELSGNFTMVGSSDYEYSPTAVTARYAPISEEKQHIADDLPVHSFCNHFPVL